ncbi:MAG TPA: hypothetical protein VMF53_13250 [Alphaproteobacteria bacterium]|nr:hypothetical protein [Alphaproteobacteria bacterium]
MIGGPFKKLLLVILSLPAILILIYGLAIIFSPIVELFSLRAGYAMAFLAMWFPTWVVGCPMDTAGSTPLPYPPWFVEERWEHCSAISDGPTEIVAINGKKHQEIRVALIDISGGYGPGLGLDDRGQVVVVVPKGSKVSGARNEVLGLKVIYKSYDGYDDAVRKNWIAWTADPKNPALAAWYRQQPDFPAPEPAATK